MERPPDRLYVGPGGRVCRRTAQGRDAGPRELRPREVVRVVRSVSQDRRRSVSILSRLEHVMPPERVEKVRLALLLLIATLVAGEHSGPVIAGAPLSQPMRGVLVTPPQVTPPQLRTWKKQGCNAVVLSLADRARPAPV